MWQFVRHPWELVSGGAASGIYRSKDGGLTWERLKEGLPAGLLGRIAVAVGPTNPSHVYALIETTQGMLWDSKDQGDHWTKVSDFHGLSARPFYFSLQQVRREEYFAVVRGRNVQQREVERPGGEPVEIRHLGPVVALVLRIPQHPLLGLDERVHVARIRGTGRDGDAAERAGGKPLAQAFPRDAAVLGPIDAAPRSAGHELPRIAHELPHAREQHPGIARHHD